MFAAAQIGWDREHIGSHVVRRNVIFDCGQNGVVGHLGCVFSTIEDNHIYNIALKREFYGHEIAGIKLHAAIDVQVRHNRIHDCSLGTWLDWQAQGTRVSRNLYYRNNRDLFVEVSHGPYLVEHNVLASPVALESFSQGGAYVHNLVGGTVHLEQVMERATPYHRPHSTQVAGYAVVYGGDDRFIGNVFLGGDMAKAYARMAEGKQPPGYGTAGYVGHPSSFDEYLARVAEQPPGDLLRFIGVKQPVYMRDNVYAAGARPFADERSALALTEDVLLELVDEGDEVYLAARLPEVFGRVRLGIITGADLPRVRFADADFEECDASPLVIDLDLLGERKQPGRVYPAGPIAGLTPGTSRLRVLAGAAPDWLIHARDRRPKRGSPSEPPKGRQMSWRCASCLRVPFWAISSSRVPCSTIWPAAITMMRSASRMVESRWAMTTRVARSPAMAPATCD